MFAHLEVVRSQISFFIEFNDLVRRVDPNDSPYYWIRGRENEPKPDTDVYEILKNRNISLSPIVIESARDAELEALREFLSD